MGLPAELAYPSAPDGADEPTRLATQAWGQVARLFLSQQHRRDQIAADLGLHTSDLISLFHMTPDAGISQRDLAQHWACDPSWVTNRIDQLESLGLAERRVSTTDRRVKEVWLTPSGVKRRADGMAAFGQPPEALLELPLEDLRSMTEVLASLDLPDPM